MTAILTCSTIALTGCVSSTEDKVVEQQPAKTASVEQVEAQPPAKTTGGKTTIASLPKIDAQKSRLIVYRSSYLGLAIQPKIYVDGRQTGTCTPGTAIAIDLPPGEHALSATTETKKVSSVNLSPGTTTYVNCRITAGFAIGRATFEQVPSSIAVPKAGSMRLQGRY